ncbi:MAG: hypothetical protein KC505_00725 [Myxococcales bacterium]|nr:hypothetical protein [Myxococcales bacterium]USN51340.1 MAG: hypothetical protein H6731_02735 [Myxococcales bacterium]
MKKFLALIFLILLAVIGYVSYAHLSGGAVPTFGLPIGGEQVLIRKQALRFFEDIKFKNMSGLKDFVDENTDLATVNNFIVKTIGFVPENVDLQSMKVENIELDSTKKRARVKIHLTGIELSEHKPFDSNKIIFLYQADKHRWLIDVDNISL